MAGFFRYVTLDILWQGILIAVEIAVVAMIAALILGLVLALMRQSSLPFLSIPATIYVWFIRGTPLLLQLVFLYDVLPAAHIVLPSIPTAMLGFALNEAAFAGEIIRGGIKSVNRSQVIAAQSLGMSPFLTLRKIILPQAMRAILPALGNDAISLVKSTSLASVIAVNELTLRGEEIVAQNFRFFEVFTAAGAIYLIVTSVLAVGQIILERRFNLDREVGPGQGLMRRWTGINLSLPFLRPAASRPNAGSDVLLAAAQSGTIVPTGILPEGTPLPEKPTGIAELVARQSSAGTGASGPDFVVCRGVWKSYGQREILRGIDLTVKPGEVVVIMGPSGSGKSTLLRLVNHLEPVDRGEIKVGGEYVGYRQVNGNLRPVRNLAKARADARIGMVFQHFNLFDHLPVVENVTIAPVFVYREKKQTAQENALDLLADVGLRHHAWHLPHRLSGGQQQRVAIARALAVSPKLMLFDEPTSALDPELVGEVLNVIRRLAVAGMTMLVVTHEVRFARDVADRVVFMDEGRVVEQGPPAQVLDHPQDERTMRFLNLVERATGTF